MLVRQFDYCLNWIQVTNESLRSIASLPKLEELVMVGCPLVNDMGFQFLENGCSLLQVLSFPCDGLI